LHLQGTVQFHLETTRYDGDNSIYSVDGATSNKCLHVYVAHGLQVRLPVFVATAFSETRDCNPGSDFSIPGLAIG